MSDHIYIKCLDEMSGYNPYKVYGEDDWMLVMWNDKMHGVRTDWVGVDKPIDFSSLPAKHMHCICWR